MKESGLRLSQLAPTPVLEDEVAVPPVLVVASGKGGVGKSVVSILLSNALAEAGHRVLLFDGAQNLGHLHVLLGLSPKRRLEHLVKGEIEPNEMLLSVRDGLWLVPGDSGAEALYGLPAIDQARLHHRLCQLYHGFDVVVVDAGAGVEGAIRLATMGGTRLAVVTVPEVAALTDAYALIKLVHAQLPTLPIDVIVNRTAGSADTQETFDRLAAAVDRFLGRALSLLGGIPETAALRDALRRPGGILADPGLVPLRAEVHALSQLTLALLAGSSAQSPNGRTS